MRKLVLGAWMLGLCGSANAATYFATIQGTVSSQFNTVFTDQNAPSSINVGDTISATFSFNTGSSVAEMLARSLGVVGANRATFQLGGFTWTSAGDFLGPDAPPQFAFGPDPLKDYYSTMDDAPGGGDLHIEGYAFEIGEFGYDLYTGFGYRGAFDRDTLSVRMDGETLVPPASRTFVQAVTTVPEPATWAMMISGFGLVGAALRRRTAKPIAA